MKRIDFEKLTYIAKNNGLKAIVSHDYWIEPLEYYGHVALFYNNNEVGRFCYEDRGESKTGIRLFSIHSDLDHEHNGKGWGLLGYLLLLEQLQKKFPKSYVGPSEEFGSYTSPSAAKVWEIIIKSKILRTSMLSPVIGKVNKVRVFKYIGPKILGNVIGKFKGVHSLGEERCFDVAEVEGLNPSGPIRREI